MRRRGAPGQPSFTSLLDVLFILVFATLVHEAASRQGAAAPAPSPTPTPAVAAAAVDAGTPAPAPAPAPGYAELRRAALTALRDDLGGRPALIAHVSRDGRLVAVELADRRIELGVPLLARVPDPDVQLSYLGDTSPALRVCAVVAQALGARDLAGDLVVITADAPLGELTVALVAGLRRDAERCLPDQRAVAVVVDPAPLAGAPPAPGGTPP
jgi:hypothetical protein